MIKDDKIKRFLKFLKTEAKYFTQRDGYYLFWRETKYQGMDNRVSAYDLRIETVNCLLHADLSSLKEVTI
ncbi:MAG: hypothetical protein KA968_08035 [Chitinophagaceae bacterium]|nr:hypothetical protein [Chitinophagaceae bacterium]